MESGKTISASNIVNAEWKSRSLRLQSGDSARWWYGRVASFEGKVVVAVLGDTRCCST